MAVLLGTTVAGNVSVNTGGILTNIASGLIQSNTINLVIQTIAVSNANIVLSSNGTGNVVLSNTGNLTVSGNIVTTRNIANAGNLLVTQNTFTGNLSVTTLMNVTTGNILTVNANTINVNTIISLAAGTGGLNLQGGLVASNANVRLWANGVEWIRVTNTGVVIGTAQPNSNLTITGNIYVTTGMNVSGTANIVTGNIRNYGVYANGTVVVGNIANLNFNNTSTINVASVANGTQSNVEFSVNTSAIGGGGGAVSNSGVLVLGMPNANINLLGTSTVNAVAVANGTTQVNISFSVNTTAVGSSATSPGGANQQFQFNNNGVIFGSANAVINLTSNTMTFGSNIEVTNAFFNVATTANGAGPLTLTANQAIVYARNIANSIMLFVDTGRPNTSLFNDAYAISPSEFSKVISTCTPNTFGVVNTTCFMSYGMFQSTMNIIALTAMCNLANGIPANATPTLRRSMKRFQLGANANLITGNATIFANSNVFWAGGVQTGNAGGYILRWKFSVDNYPQNTRIFVGISNAIASMVSSITDVDPLSNSSNSWTIFGIGANGNTSTATGNLFITYGTATNPRTTLDLGNQYTLVGNTDVYELTINCPPGGAWIGWTVRNLANGAANTGVVTTSSAIPQANVFMQPVAFLKSNAAIVSNISIMKIYAETTG
jgi:hypothetical protein